MADPAVDHLRTAFYADGTTQKPAIVQWFESQLDDKTLYGPSRGVYQWAYSGGHQGTTDMALKPNGEAIIKKARMTRHAKQYGIVVQMYGTVQAQKCGYCASMHDAPFSECRSVPDAFYGCCANCVFQERKHCSVSPNKALRSRKSAIAFRKAHKDANGGDETTSDREQSLTRSKRKSSVVEASPPALKSLKKQRQAPSSPALPNVQLDTAMNIRGELRKMRAAMKRIENMLDENEEESEEEI